MKEFITSFYSFDYVAKEMEPPSSHEDEKNNLLIQESSESNSQVTKPKQKRIPPIVNELPASESNSEAEKEIENLLQDDHYDIVIEK